LYQFVWKGVAALSIGERLRAARKLKKLTLKDTASELGIAKSTYAAYESGFRSPSLQTISAAATLLDTSSDYLLGITDQPSVDSNNAKTLLQNKQLHWDGEPLTTEDLELINTLLERIINGRPSKDKNKN
jgi:transcriptional regulator with XRE-family HTH domain